MVSKAVDEGVEHGRDDGIEDGHHLVEADGRGRSGADVHEEESAVEEAHHGQVGRAGGEGLSALRSRVDPKQRPDDAAIGCGNDRRGGQEHGQGDQEVCGLLRGDIRAGQGQQWRGIAEEVVYDVGATKRQSGHEVNGQHGGEKAPQPTGGCQADAGAPGHQGRVPERQADGHVAVVGHGGQQEALGGTKEGEDKKLGEAACVGDPLASSHPKEARQHLGHRDRSVADFKAGQVRQEEIHGPMEAVVQAHQHDDGQVLHQGEQVHGEEEREKEEAHLTHLSEAHQDKLRRVGLVGSVGLHN